MHKISQNIPRDKRPTIIIVHAIEVFGFNGTPLFICCNTKKSQTITISINLPNSL